MISRSIAGALLLLLTSPIAFSKENHLSGVERCMAISKGAHPHRPTTSFVDAEKSYFLVRGVEFGEYNDGQAFVSLRGRTVKLSDRSFTLPDGSTKKFDVDGVAMMQASIYYLTSGKNTVFCIETPTSGLGMSGDFQHYVYLLEFDTSAPLTSKQGFRAALLKSARGAKK